MRYSKTIAFIIFFLFFSIGILSRSPGMITWDEPENYYVGRVYVNTLTGQNIPQALPLREDSHWERYPPLAITIASMISLVLSETLHLVDPIDAHHIAVIGFGALASVATYAIALELGMTIYTAVAASVILFFSPVFFAHAHTNPKDIPQAAMFALAVYAGLCAFRKKTYAAYFYAGLAWGCALATKFNALFAPFVIVLGTAHGIRMWRRQVPYVAVYTVTALATLFLLWPWLASDPVQHLGQIVQYVSEVGKGLNVLFFGQLYSAGITVPWWYAPTMVWVQTPPVLLLFVLIGIWVSVRKRMMVPLMWLIVVFARYIDSRVIIYNGVRHVMEVFPVVALLAGLGGDAIRLHIQRMGLSPRVSRIVISAVIVVSLALPIMRMHPYEAMYFNAFAGGPQKASHTFDFDYWGFSIGELVTRVNAIEQDRTKRVYVIWLGFPGAYFPSNRLQFVTSDAERADYVIVPNSRNFFEGAIMYWHKHGRLIYTVTAGGADIGYLFATNP